MPSSPKSNGAVVALPTLPSPPDRSMRIPDLVPGHGPLSAAQAAQFNAFAANLSPEQTAWLLGYLTATQHMQGATAQVLAPSTATASEERLTVLFASQTGNSAKLAKHLVAAASTAGLHAAAVSTSEYKTANLRNETSLVLIASTQGEGDPPDSAVEFHRFLFSKRAPRLEKLRFAVLALGDYSYTHFCKAGADFDQRLEELGGRRVLARVDCDVEYQADAEAWQGQVVEAFKGLLGGKDASTPTVALSVLAAEDTGYDKANPFSAAVLERTNLNGRGSAKKTFHIELSLTGSGMTYQPGDSLGVLPRNAPDYVRDILVATHLAADASVTVDGKQRQLIAALAETFEITTITRPFVKAYVAETEHAELGALLEKGHEEGFRKYTHGREIIDVLQAFPPGELSAQGLRGHAAAAATAPLLHRIEPARPRGRGPPAGRAHALRKPRPHARRRVLVLSVRAPRRRRAAARLPLGQPKLQASGKPRRSDHHDRSRHRRGAVSRLRRGTRGPGLPRAQLALLRRPAFRHRLPVPARVAALAQVRRAVAPRPGLLARPGGQDLRPAAHARERTRSLRVAAGRRPRLRVRRRRRHGGRCPRGADRHRRARKAARTATPPSSTSNNCRPTSVTSGTCTDLGESSNE